jgi:hypothetical protein
METDEAGNCKGCGMAYSFVFGMQFHKKGCPYEVRKDGEPRNIS